MDPDKVDDDHNNTVTVNDSYTIAVSTTDKLTLTPDFSEPYEEN